MSQLAPSLPLITFSSAGVRMPNAKSVKDAPEPTPQEEPTVLAADTTRALESAPEQAGPEPGVYEYTHWADCVYPSVPLTARAGQPARPATDDNPDAPEVPATVFAWPFGPPDDGRWTKTRKKPNQAADNAGPLTSEE